MPTKKKRSGGGRRKARRWINPVAVCSAQERRLNRNWTDRQKESCIKSIKRDAPKRGYKVTSKKVGRDGRLI